MSRKSPASVIAAMNVLLTKKQIKAIAAEAGSAIMKRNVQQVVRYLITLGIAENDRRNEAMRLTVMKLDSELLKQAGAHLHEQR